MSIQSEINRIAGAKSDIADAIEDKGVTVPSGTKLDGMANLIGQISGGSAKLNSTQAADAYDPTATYAVGDKVSYAGNVYSCISAISTPEAWDSTHWDQVDPIQDQIDDVRNTLNQLVRPNLLDNWYFVGGGTQVNSRFFPINQRRQATYNNVGYTIDRWKLTSGSVELVSGGITLNGTLVQIFEESIGHTVTASALLSDGTMVTPTYDDTTKTFTLTATGQTVVAAKLEVGIGQTLAHLENGVWVLNEIPNLEVELARCQKYYLNLNMFNNQYTTVGFAYAAGSDNINVIVSFPVTFRYAVFSQSYKDTIVFQVGSTYKFATSPTIAIYNRSVGSMQVNISGFSGLTVGSFGICYLQDYGTITFSVDL